MADETVMASMHTSIHEGIKTGVAEAEARPVRERQADESARLGEIERTQQEDRFATQLEQGLQKIPFADGLAVSRSAGRLDKIEDCWGQPNRTFVEVAGEVGHWPGNQTTKQKVAFAVRPFGITLRGYRSDLDLQPGKTYTDPVPVVGAVAKWAARNRLLAKSL